MYNSELFQNTNETNITGDNNYINNETDVNFTMNNDNANSMPSGGCMQNGVQERVVHRTFVHDVPQE